MSEIINELNNNCCHDDDKYFEKCTWDKDDFYEDLCPTRNYCSKLYTMGKKVDMCPIEYVMCDSCASILSEYKNNTKVKSNTQDTMMESVLNRLDELERTVRKITQHMNYKMDSYSSYTKDYS